VSYTELHFGDSAQINAVRKGGTIHVSMHQPAGDLLAMALQDDNCGPVAALELFGALGDVLVAEGMRGETDRRYGYSIRKQFGTAAS
jgi:hypothetical protein